MIELKNLSKTFFTTDGTLDALKNINITIQDGDIFGIIGMSGAGKSTVSKTFADCGAAVFNADEIVAELYSDNSPCLRTIAACFGADVLKSDGALFMSYVIFCQPYSVTRREVSALIFSTGSISVRPMIERI